VLDSIPEDEKPEACFWITDNGSGYDPLDKTNQYYLGKTVDEQGLLFGGTGSYAARESSMNEGIERPWGQHKKCIVGQRFGEPFLGGRRASNADEMHDLFRHAAKEMADLRESTVNITPSEGEKVAPKCIYIEPPTASEIEAARRVKGFLSTKVRREVEKEGNTELRKYVRDLNSRTVQYLNCVWVFSKRCTPEILRSLFGPNEKPFQAETFVSEKDGRKNHKTDLMLKEK
jgi:hypothetical protein